MNRPSRSIIIILVVSLIGSVLEIWGGSWDITSHLLGAPETFFTPPHTILYSGVGISLIASILASIVLFRDKELRNTSSSFGLKLIIIGSVSFKFLPDLVTMHGMKCSEQMDYLVRRILL